MEGDQHQFRVVVVRAEDELWTQKVLDGVKSLEWLLPDEWNAGSMADLRCLDPLRGRSRFLACSAVSLVPRSTAG